MNHNQYGISWVIRVYEKSPQLRTNQPLNRTQDAASCLPFTCVHLQRVRRQLTVWRRFKAKCSSGGTGFDSRLAEHQTSLSLEAPAEPEPSSSTSPQRARTAATGAGIHGSWEWRDVAGG